MELTRLVGTTNLIAAEHLVKISLLLPADSAIMKMLDPLGQSLVDSFSSPAPNTGDASFYASWRALALGLLEYRRGNFSTSADWLGKCSSYPGEAPSCKAASHVLLSMSFSQLGRTQEADTELTLGKQMIGEHFEKKLEIWDSVSGHLEGWLTARLFLRQAEEEEKNTSALEQ